VNLRAALPVLLVLVLGCSSTVAPNVLGEWGGQEASLTLTVSGGSVSYLCGAGTIDSAWTLTSAGQFSASGEHFFGGGPIPVEGAPPHPARYTGHVDGQSLTLSVYLTDSKATLGPFHLIRGGPPVYELCD
jgi:hypothetical protein